MESQMAKRSCRGCRFYKSYSHEFDPKASLHFGGVVMKNENKKLVWLLFSLGKNACHPYYSFSIPTKCEESMPKRVKKFDEFKK